jgi:hypothetical protein
VNLLGGNLVLQEIAVAKIKQSNYYTSATWPHATSEQNIAPLSGAWRKNDTLI